MSKKAEGGSECSVCFTVGPGIAISDLKTQPHQGIWGFDYSWVV